MFSRIKLSALAIAGAVLTALVGTVKLLSRQNSRLRHRAENAEMKVKRAVIIAKAEKEIEKTWDKVRDEEKSSDHPGFDDPNSLWDDRNNS